MKRTISLFNFLKPKPKAANKIAAIALIHQLKSAFVTVKWPLKMMEEGDYGQINPEQRIVIEKILTRNEEFISLIDDLLSLEKSATGGYSYHRTCENMESIIRELMKATREEATHKHITMMFEKQSGVIPDVMLDKKMITLAVQNLIDNAIKYTMPGGEIAISLSANKKSIECKVEDNGIGVMEKDKSKIFSQFFRGVNAIKANSVGSGLGLFITKNIIEDHKGKIWFTSEEGKGSTFCFSLPL